MANLVITTGEKMINFELNDYAPILGSLNILRPKSSVLKVTLKATHIEYIVADNFSSYILHYTTNSINAVIVDSIDGTTFTSLQELYDKIKTVLNT